MSDIFPQKNWRLVVVLLAIGLLSGVIGAYLFNGLLLYYINSNNLISPQFTEKYNNQSQIVIQDPKKIVVEQDTGIAETVKAGTGFLMGFYAKSADGNYDLDRFSGQGLMLSADGWLLSINDKVKNQDDWLDLVAISQDNKIYTIEKAAKDKSSGYWLVKLKDASSMPVTPLASARNLDAGQMVVVVGWRKLPLVSYYRGSAFKQKIRSSDTPGRSLVLSNEIDGQLLVLDMARQVVGIAIGKNLESVDYILPLVNNLSMEQAVRPVLGLYYRDLSDYVSKPEQKGVQVVKSDKNPAVIKGAAADRAGIKEGDIIVSVDNIELNKDNDLAELIALYKPKSKIYLKIRRDATEKIIEMNLD